MIGAAAKQIDTSTNEIDAPAPWGGMDKMLITGGQQLRGNVTISGAKNAALKHMCAALLCDGTLTLDNTPTSLRDIISQVDLLEHLGAIVTTTNKHMEIDARNISSQIAPYELVRKMRGSVLVLGPLLARFGKASVSLPGGCAIGTRPVDLHLKGLEALGATISLEDGYINAVAPKGGLKGGRIAFPIVSVGATENMMMAATLAYGETVISGAAREPEIADLAKCLNAMGAKIEGAGTPTIRIQGVKNSLSSADHSIMPDRIEAGTWIIGAALTGGRAVLKGADLNHLSALTGILESAGGVLIKQLENGDVLVEGNGDKLQGVDIMTTPYPGFPTDLQAQIMTILSLANGSSMITETIFENRFMHVPELCRMGANINVQGNSAIVRGVKELTGAQVMATDLRASVSLVLAGLVARGTTEISRIYHLERGYEDIISKLQGLGVEAKQVAGK